MRSCKFTIYLLILLTTVGTLSASRIEKRAKKCVPPVARKSEFTQTVHDITLDDPYHWMIDKERTNDEGRKYIEAENDYARCVTRDLEDDIEKLFLEMKGRMKETDMTMPVKIDSFFYYNRTVAGKQYTIYCRKKGTLLAPEEVILDVNEMAKGHDFFEVGFIDYSPNHRYMAYSVDTTGFESYTLYIKDLTTGKNLPDIIPYVNSFSWTMDNKTFYYVRDLEDDQESPSNLLRHTLGDDPEQDEVIFREKDLSFGLYVYLSRDRKWLFFGSISNDTSEVWFLPADKPFDEFTLIRPREEGILYSIDAADTLMYIDTNLDDPEFRLVTATFSKPDVWTPFYVPEEGVTLNGCDVFKDYMSLYVQKDALEHLIILDFRTGEYTPVEFPQEVYTFWTHWNPQYDNRRLRLTYSSPTMPMTIYEYDLDKKRLDFLKRYDIPEGYNSDDYVTKRIFAPTADSVMVPITLLYRREFEGQSKPLYLNAYGSYGTISETYFSTTAFSLVDRGFTYAIAHVRGGSEWGEWWHEDGRLMTKKNTYSDFITCSEYLISEGYTDKDHLVIEGASAGGLLMGVVVNWRPDLFKLVIADVPAVNEIDILLDPTIPGALYHYTEWGDPGDPEQFSYMFSWDPYYNVSKQDYPHILATAGFEDNRVPYWEPARWVARLRANKTDDNILVFKTEMSGHSGASGRYDYLRELAFNYAFILDLLEIPVDKK